MKNLKINSPQELASYIDHTCLKADTDEEKIISLCQEADQYQFATICIPPLFLKLASKLLKNSPCKPITVVGFPLGYNDSLTKAFETEKSIENGAQEIDMVIAIGALKNKEFSYVRQDIETVVKSASNIPVKVIIETALLSKEEKKISCQLSQEAGAAFVKTSTGFSTAGATVSDIQLIRSIVGNDMGVKASGGIKTYQDALNMINAGANRLGTSSSVSIVTTNIRG